MKSIIIKCVPRFILDKINQSPETYKIVNNIGWLFIDKILRMGLGVIVGVWLARYLKPEAYGVLNYAQAFVGILSIVASLGLSEIIVRDLVNSSSNQNLILGTGFVLRLIGGLVAYFISLGLIFYFKPNDSIIIIIVSIMGLNLILQSSDVIRYWFESRIQSKFPVFLDNIIFIGITIIKVGLIILKTPLIYFVILSFVEALITALFLFILYQKKALNIQLWSFNFDLSKQLLKDSWPLILSGIAISVFMKIDQIMLGQMLGSKSVGLYSAAVKISEVWYFIPVVVVSSFFPSILNSKLNDEKLYYKKLQFLFDVLVWFAIFVSILMTFFSDSIILLLYGKDYSEAGNVLKIHIWTGVEVCFGIVWSKWILIENKSKMIIIFHLMAMIINIIYNYYFIPSQGVVGAAIATALASATAQGLGILFYKRKIAFNFLIKSLIPIHLFNNKI